MLGILSIGGSDPSSGAGVQGDVRACQSLGAYCFTAVTAVTSQNTTKFGLTEPASPKILKSQIEMILEDFGVDAIKIGMVHDSGAARTIAEMLSGRDIPVVLDPVIESTTGGVLARKDAIRKLKSQLVPLATVVTPNRFEAEVLTGIKASTRQAAEDAAARILHMGAKSTVITGLEVKRGQVADYLLTGTTGHWFFQKKYSRPSHGGGCNYSLALSYCLAGKKPVRDAVLFARRFARHSIRNSAKLGAGVRIVLPGSDDGAHCHAHDAIRVGLSNGISSFLSMPGSYMLIPECQTNFVFSKSRPSSTRDVAGVEGRLVRAGRRVAMAGSLKYGGSQHVASAVLAMSTKFPHIRSAINIRFDDNMVSRLRDARLAVLEYDRAREPHRVRDAEGMSVSWGIRRAIKGAKMPPDAVFHRGGFGKEPMIILFGTDPSDVIAKLRAAFGQAAHQPRACT